MWIAAAVVLAVPTRVRAQQDSDLTELIVSVRIERGPEQVLVALARDSLVLLPVRKVLDLAEVRVAEAVPGQRLAGVLEPEGVAFWFDTQNGTRGRVGATGALDSADAVWRGDELYVSLPVFSDVLGVHAQMSWPDLTVVISHADSLPVRRRLAREARRATLIAATAAPPPAPLLGTPQRLLDGGVADWSVLFSSHDPADNWGGQFGLGLDVAGGSLTSTTVLTRSPGTLSHDTRTAWQRAWPDSRVVQQVLLGDVVLDGPRERAVNGAAITNVPFLRQAAFGTDQLAGDLGAGWEVDLSSAGRLIAATTTDSAGHYTIPVPLYYGPNPAEVEAYGPTGEVRRFGREFDVPFERLPAGRFEYLIGGGECTYDPCSRMFIADTRYGVSRRVTLRGGVDGFAVAGAGDRWHPYAQASASPLASLSLTGDLVARALRELRFTYAPDADLLLTGDLAAFDSSDASGLYSAATERGQTNLTLFWRPGGGVVQVTGLFLQSRTSTGEQSTASLGPTLRLSSAVLSVAAAEQRISLGGATSVASGADLAAHWIVPTAVPALGKGLVSFSAMLRCPSDLPTCLPKVEQWEIEAGRQLIPSMRLDAAFTWFSQPRRVVVDVTLSTELPTLRALSRAGYQTGGGVEGTQALEGSVVLDRTRHRLGLGDGRSVGRAGITGVVFRDANGNGVQDPDEGGVPDVLLRIGATAVTTDSLGRFAVFDLLPFERTVVEVDTLALADPTWIPAQQRVAVRPIPNGYRFVAVPLIEGRELSGDVLLGGAGVPQVRVRAHNTASGRDVVLTTYSDGTFYAPSLPPGDYVLTLEREDLGRLHAFGAPVHVTIARTGETAPVHIRLLGAPGS